MFIAVTLYYYQEIKKTFTLITYDHAKCAHRAQASGVSVFPTISYSNTHSKYGADEFGLWLTRHRYHNRESSAAMAASNLITRNLFPPISSITFVFLQSVCSSWNIEQTMIFLFASFPFAMDVFLFVWRDVNDRKAQQHRESTEKLNLNKNNPTEQEKQYIENMWKKDQLNVIDTHSNSH